MSKHTYTISFFVTNNCNLSCSYCYEKNKTNQFASFNNFQKIIDDVFLKYSNEYFLIFDFFGGEPFLHFPFIKDITEYIKLKYSNKNFSLSVSTNGTILNDNIKKFLLHNRKIFDVGISIDGCFLSHNTNRNKSFKNIDLSWFIDNGIVRSTKMTISVETLDNLSNNLIFCESIGLKVNCNLAFGLDWSKTQLKIFEVELRKIIKYYLSNDRINSKLPFCNLLDINWLRNICLPTEKRKRFCGAGIYMSAYDVKGDEYPCQMFAPISAGDKSLKKDNAVIYKDFIPDIESHKECNVCIYKNICRTCIGSNYINDGHLYHNDMRLCEFEKSRFKAMTYLASKLYELNKLKNYQNSNEIIKGLQIIFKHSKSP